MSLLSLNGHMYTVINDQDYKDCYDVGMQEKVNMFRLQKELEMKDKAAKK